jgi:hypothetical protein
VAEGVELAQARTLEDREGAAAACATGLNLDIPILIDAMDDAAERAFNAWPERLYVLDRAGKVAYKGGKGPYGFDPDDLNRFLNTFLGPPAIPPKASGRKPAASDPQLPSAPPR